MSEFDPLDLFKPVPETERPVEPAPASEDPEPAEKKDDAQAPRDPAGEEPAAGGTAETPCGEAEPEQTEPEPQTEPESQTEPEPQTEPRVVLPEGDLTELKQELEAVRQKLETLSGQFDRRIMYTDHEEKVIDQMHRELQRYKEDLYAQLMRPILLDIIGVRDSIMRMAATYLANPEGQQDIPNKTFSDYSYDLQDILEKNHVEIYRSEPGDGFTPLRQRAIKKIPTGEKELHGKVAESITCGYSYNGKVISPEKITVYVYVEPKEEKKEQPETAPEDNEKSEVKENG